MWVFGGCHYDERLNDLWQFSFETKTWHRVQTKGAIPKPRSSHTANVYKKYLVVFGGRYIDYVLSDIWIFDFGNEQTLFFFFFVVISTQKFTWIFSRLNNRNIDMETNQ